MHLHHSINRIRTSCLGFLAVISLAGCAPQGLYHWGDYESSLYGRYVENDPQHTEPYLSNTISDAETQHRKVPPGVYADYGFLLYTRGDKTGAIELFQKERAAYPESVALMNKLIERIQQQGKKAEPESVTLAQPVEGTAQ